METDWQISLTKIKDRGQYILEFEKFVDCQFMVGTSWDQFLITGHRLLLAMASPVFERMFYGSLPEKDDPIIIPDVQADAFEAMLNYIYTDEISISSFEDACDLYYAAKKYMLPHVVEHCTNFLLANLSPKNACRTYEFGKLYEESLLIESSMKLIAFSTLQVITDPSFMDIEVSTLMDILDQDRLNIDSELDLFNCILKLANERGILNDGDKDNKDESENANDVLEEIQIELEDSSAAAASISTGPCGSVPNVANEVVEVANHASGNANDSENANEIVVKKIKLAPDHLSSAAVSTSAGTCGNVPNVADEVNSSTSASGNAGELAVDVNNLMEAQRTTMDEAVLRQAVKKIRFLRMTPKQFSEGPARSKLLKQNEITAICTKISSLSINDCSMPEGFCQSSKRDRVGSDQKNLERFCMRGEIIRNPWMFENDYSNENIYRLAFQVKSNIYLLGIQIEMQHPCQEEDIKDFSACIQDMEESEIAYTSSIRNLYTSTLEMSFNNPVFINRNENHYIKVINKHRYSIQMFSWEKDKEEDYWERANVSILEVNPHHRHLGSPIKSIKILS